MELFRPIKILEFEKGFSWRAVCIERCKHGSEGGQGYSMFYMESPALPYRRQGLAKALMLESLRYMQAKGMKIAVVRTTASNEPAIRLYESVGFTVVDKLHKYVKH